MTQVVVPQQKDFARMHDCPSGTEVFAYDAGCRSSTEGLREDA